LGSSLSDNEKTSIIEEIKSMLGVVNDGYLDITKVRQLQEATFERKTLEDGDITNI
jgi:hypothetical protein